jgi:uncharacterized protein (TIGR03086 family)
MSEPDTLALLDQALTQMAGVIAAIDPDTEGGLATPCADWDVRALVRHVIGQDLRNFLVVARDITAAWQASADELGADWAAEFQVGADRVLDAWRAADPARLGRADQQIAELATHAWDLAKATNQSKALDDALAEHSLSWARQMLRPEHRGPDKAFGAEVPVPPDAPAYDRLAGWFGRDPGWPEGGTDA